MRWRKRIPKTNEEIKQAEQLLQDLRRRVAVIEMRVDTLEGKRVKRPDE